MWIPTANTTHLNFASNLVASGWAFIRQSWDTRADLQSPHHEINIFRVIKADLAVWVEFLDSYNRVSFWRADLHLFYSRFEYLCAHTLLDPLTGWGTLWQCASIPSGTELLVGSLSTQLVPLSVWTPIMLGRWTVAVTTLTFWGHLFSLPAFPCPSHLGDGFQLL